MRLAKIKNGLVTDLIVAEELIDGFEEVDSSVGIGWEKQGNAFVDIRPIEVVRKTIFSKFTFKKLFTNAEWVAIKQSADPIVEDFVETFQIADYIDVDHEDLVAALEYLEQSILASGRADEIRGL